MPKDRRDNTVLQAVLDLTKQVSEVQRELSVNTTETKNIVTRLDKLNGSVAKHDTAISLNEQAIALLTQTIAAVTKNQNEERKVLGNWTDWLLKGLVVLGLIILYTLLIKSKIIQPLITF